MILSTRPWAAILGLALLGGVAVATRSVAEGDKDAPAPRIAAEPTTFDFGKALQNKTLHKDFVLKNFGTADLEIKRVSTTCGCTAALADSTVIKPGASTTLRVDLQTRTYTGKLERKILVESNDPKSPLALKVLATIVAGS
jgi:Protein of unknown function (DUF1573)